MTGFGSRIDPKSKPFAWIGDRGTTIYESVEVQNLGDSDEVTVLSTRMPP